MTLNSKSSGYQIDPKYASQKVLDSKREQEQSIARLQKAVRDLNKNQSRWGVAR